MKYNRGGIEGDIKQSSKVSVSPVGLPKIKSLLQIKDINSFNKPTAISLQKQNLFPNFQHDQVTTRCDGLTGVSDQRDEMDHQSKLLINNYKKIIKVTDNQFFRYSSSVPRILEDQIENVSARHSIHSQNTKMQKQNQTEQLQYFQQLKMSPDNENNKNIDQYLHRSQISLNVAEQIKRLNIQILSDSLAVNSNNNSNSQGINNSTQNYFTNNKTASRGANLNPFREMAYNPSREMGILKSNSSQKSQPELQNGKRGDNPRKAINQRGIDNTNFKSSSTKFRRLDENPLLPNELLSQTGNGLSFQIKEPSNRQYEHQKNEENKGSANFFGLTENGKESSYQKNLLQALSLCNTRNLDSLVLSHQQNVKKKHASQLDIKKQITRRPSIPIEKGVDFKQKLNNPTNHYSLLKRSSLGMQNKEVEDKKCQPHRQPFRINVMREDAAEQQKNLDKMQKLINYKLFYSHFDDDFQEIMNQIKEEQKKEQTSSHIKKTKFNVVTPIRPEILFNIKQMIRMQRIREEKMYRQQIRPDEMIEYVKKRNQIEIILENSKKIKTLKVIADLIEKEIECQNDKISSLVTDLTAKFGLDESEQQLKTQDIFTQIISSQQN